MLILILCIQTSYFVFAQTDEIISKLQTTNNAIEYAFTTITEAENAGANITTLITQLNNALRILAEGQNAYQNGDLSTAAIKADEAVSIVQTINNNATQYRDSVSTVSRNSFLLEIVFTVLGSIAIITILILIWRRIKSQHIKKIFNGKFL